MYRIKQLRQENSLSQRALAMKIGASPKAVNFWEQEKAEPTARFIIALADAFEVSADYVLGREDDMGNVSVLRTPNEDERFLLRQFSKLTQKQKAETLNFIEFLLSK